MGLAKAYSSQFILNTTTVVHYNSHIQISRYTTTTIVDHLSIYIFATCLDY